MVVDGPGREHPAMNDCRSLGRSSMGKAMMRCTCQAKVDRGMWWAWAQARRGALCSITALTAAQILELPSAVRVPTRSRRACLDISAEDGGRGRRRGGGSGRGRKARQKRGEECAENFAQKKIKFLFLPLFVSPLHGLAPKPQTPPCAAHPRIQREKRKTLVYFFMGRDEEGAEKNMRK